MMARTHAQRILADLAEIRQELLEEAEGISPNQLDWVPATGMKSYRDILIEIGATEAENLGLILTGKADYNTAVDKVGGRGATIQAVFEDLQRIRQETIDYLDAVDEEVLQTPIPLPEDRYGLFGDLTALEPEELLRWIVRHEYYHLGQIITMRWLQGHNPYRSAD